MGSSSSAAITMILLLLLSNIITHIHSAPSDHNFCGIGFQHASQSCEHPCPSGSLDECPSGMLCYFNTPCDINQLDPNRPTKYPTRPPKLPTHSPLSISDPKRTFFCGTDWSDASSKCMVWCPNGDDSLCPFGQSCFGDTTCIKTDEGSMKELWKHYKRGNITKEDLDATLRTHKAAIDEMKSAEREAAEVLIQRAAQRGSDLIR
jgi:hypothetical protein